MGSQPTMDPNALTGPGRALARLGSAIGGLGDSFDVGVNAEQQKEQWYNDQLTMYKADTEIGLSETQAQASYQGDGSDYYDNRKTYYENTVADTLQKITPENVPRAQVFFEQRRGPALEGALRFGQSRRVAHIETKIGSVIETEVGRIASAKPEEFDRRASESIAGINGAITGAYVNGGPLSDGDKDKLSRNAAELMSRALLGLALDEKTAPEIIPKIKSFIANPQAFGIVGGAAPGAAQGAAPMPGQPGSPSGPTEFRPALRSNLGGPGSADDVGAPANADPKAVENAAAVAQRIGVSPRAVGEVFHMESGWNPKTKTGSYMGLSQVGPKTLAEMGVSKAEYQNMTQAEQAAFYGKWLDHYQFSEKMQAAGVDLASLPPARQAAVLQAFQFSPNGDWVTRLAKGDTSTPVTNAAQAKALGSTSIADMEGYFASRMTPVAQRGLTQYAGLANGGTQVANGSGAVPQSADRTQAAGTARDFLRTALTDSRKQASGTTDVDNLHPVMQDRLAAFVAAARAEGHEIKVQSGARDAQRQARLWNQALKKYGSAAEARKWVAPPGRSTHGDGMAVDLAYMDRGAGLGGKKTAAVAWAHANASKFGLSFPLGHEDWHIEPAEARSGGRRYANAGDLQGAQTYWRPDMGGASQTAPDGNASSTNTIPGATQVADSSGTQGWRPVDSHLHEILTKQMPQLERMERGILSRAEATEKAEEEALQQEIRKEASDLLVERKLTKEWVRSHREVLPASVYDDLLRQVSPMVRVTDPVTRADLMERADEDPDGVFEEADAAYGAGRLKLEDVEQIRSKINKFTNPDTRPPQWVREYRTQIKRLIRPPNEDKDPATMKRYGETLERFDNFWMEQQQAKKEDRKGVAEFADRLVKEHRSGLVEDRRKELSMPRFSQVGREGMTADEIDVAVQRTIEALRTGKISREAAQTEAALLRSWRRVLEAEAAAQGKTLKSVAPPLNQSTPPPKPGVDKKPEPQVAPKTPPPPEPKPQSKVAPSADPSQDDGEGGTVYEPKGPMFLGGPKPQASARQFRIVRDENGMLTGVIQEPYAEAAQ